LGKNKASNNRYVKYEGNAFAKRKISYNIIRQHKKSLLKYTELDVISLRILKLKENLGGFMSMEQMNDVWGLLLKS
jgi:hypothetical protein